MSDPEIVGSFVLDNDIDTHIDAHQGDEYDAYRELPDKRLQLVRLFAARGILQAVVVDENTRELSSDPNDLSTWVDNRGNKNPKFLIYVLRDTDDGSSPVAEHVTYKFVD